MARLLATIVAAFAACWFGAGPALAQPQSQWDGVARIVVIGDLHGDYEKFADIVHDAGLVDERGNWIGGRTHLVQLGDVPDRGPDTRRILDLLMRIEPQARRAGGYVHALIGNHEAMNMEGDQRYTSAGEYAAFADRDSARRRDQFYERTVEYLRAHMPESERPTFDEAFRTQWESQHPLGYVEHRLAFAPSGEYGRWIAGQNAVIRINDTLFMHGGLGPSFADADRDRLNQAVRAALRGSPEAAFPDVLTNEEGPLWYRGFAVHLETDEQANVDEVLAHNGVSRIVVGHTKRAPTVFPRFGGHVILTDIAVPPGRDDPHAYLIIEGDDLTTVHRGRHVPLHAATQQQTCAYLSQVAAADGPDGPVATLASRCAEPEREVVVAPEAF